MIRVWEGVTGTRVAFEVVDRRPGDAVAVWAATELAESKLGWRAKLGLAEMCRDQWEWARRHPHGFCGKGGATDGAEGAPASGAAV
jgi:UDP-glucose 4-epimerase